MLRSKFVRYCLSAGFAFLACFVAHAQTPTITSISPNPGGIGQSVTIAGTNFGTSGTVTFNAVAASTTNWTATSISATVPVGATTGNVVVTSGGHSSSGFPFTLNNGPVNYIYDDLGRLVAVIDANGNAAEYSYDAVGNILSISRFTATQVSVINFTPESGPVGTTVTINGTGFSATPSQNTVKFNGTAATVSAATTNQLQVSVPSATTGPISVTSPNGSATSAGNFTVTSSNGVPTITSFSPTSGISGATVNLVGTNFDPTLANDKLRLNASRAVVSTVTPTTIATTVPAATASGHFTLLAPAGNAVSSQDFYVPFLTHVPGDIGFTARVTPGVSQPVTLGASQIAMLLFDGIEGQHVDIGWTGTTFSTCNLYLIAPDNSTTATTTCTAANTSLPSTYLPKSGTYTIGIDPGTSSGSLTLSLSEDIVTAIAIGGPPVTVTTTAVGQDARLLFTADPGNRIVVYATNVTNPQATVALLTPAGTIQTFIGINNNQPGWTFYMDAQTLVTGGAYELWVQHASSNVGSETLQIVTVPADFTGVLTVPAPGATGGALRAPASGNLAVGQNASLTFNGTAGQKLSFNLLNSTIGASSTACDLTVYDPNHIAISSTLCGTGTSYLDTLTLATTGTYTVYIDPQQTATGSVSVSINNDQDVTTPAISIGGSAVTPSTTVPGQDVHLSFAATAAQRVVVYATNVTNPDATLNLITPPGATQASVVIVNNPSGQTFFLDTQTLATTGAYQLEVQHTGANFGSETLQIVSVPADFVGTLTVPAAGVKGTAVRVPTTGSLAAGQNVSLTFSGTAAQKLSFNVTGSTIGTSYTACTLTVTGPSPSTTQITYGYCGYQGPGYIDTVTIPTTGTYTVSINPQGAATGSVSISINNAQDVTTPAITIGGSAVTAKTTVAGQDVRLSFTPSSSQPRIAILATNVTNPSATLNLWTGTSTQASTTIDNSPSGQTFYIDTQSVNANQQYQLWVEHSAANHGNEGLQIKNVPADLSHTVTVGGAAYAFSTVIGQNANITFTTSSSESVTVHWTSGTYPSTLNCYMRVTGPSPSTNQVGFGNCNTATGSVSLGTIASGTYNILVDPQAQSAGGMSLTVTTP